MKATNITGNKRDKIRKERLKNESLTNDTLLNLVKQGKIERARQILLFHTSPRSFPQKIKDLLNRLSKDFYVTNKSNKRNFIIFISKLALDLLSFKPYWSLKNTNIHGRKVLTEVDLEVVIKDCMSVIDAWCALEQNLEAEILNKWKSEEEVRFKVEGVKDKISATRLARKLVSNSITSYIRNIVKSFKESNLRKICDMRFIGKTKTEIGNDHSTNLEYAMWLGASFVTTNPVLIQVAWDLNKKIWTPRVDEKIKKQFSNKELSTLIMGGNKKLINEASEIVTTDITIEVVAKNAILLRGIFLLTEGEKGLVCLQVNPRKHAKTKDMVKEALFAYSKLEQKLGGVPNVVFKLPATLAGIRAAQDLTNSGIGVTITVSFGLFQALPFAEVINQGHAIVSYLVVMNGRLAAPVVENLKDDYLAFSDQGQWAGVAVAKRLWSILYRSVDEGGKGYDQGKIKLIIASLRNYSGYFPDISELIGVPIITVFPNIRFAFDNQPVEIDPEAIKQPVKPQVIEHLLKSDLFRQAYFIKEDDVEFKPKKPFFLEDEDKVLKFSPVNQTLGQFCEYYDKTKESVIERMHKIYYAAKN